MTAEQVAHSQWSVLCTPSRMAGTRGPRGRAKTPRRCHLGQAVESHSEKVPPRGGFFSNYPYGSEPHPPNLTQGLKVNHQPASHAPFNCRSEQGRESEIWAKRLRFHIQSQPSLQVSSRAPVPPPPAATGILAESQSHHRCPQGLPSSSGAC